MILPSVSTWLAGLRKPSLFLRGDGGVPPRPVPGYGSFFYPDIEIGAFAHRYLAAEVKFIRDSDASGSISKALGQALVYRAAGISVVFVILVDCRSRGRSSSDGDGVFEDLARKFSIHIVYKSSSQSTVDSPKMPG